MNYSSYTKTDAAWEEAQVGGHVVRQESAQDSNARSLADEIQGLLGDGCEVDAGFFEAAWTYGVMASVQDYTRRRKADTQPRPDCALVDLNRIGAWSWMESPLEGAASSTTVYSVAPAKGNWPKWLQGCSNIEDAPLSDSSTVWSSTDFSNEADTAMYPMTLGLACQLLHVGDQCTEAAIKAAYRRVVKQWHPDQFESVDEFRQARANERMTAINDAYRLLRSTVSGV